MKKQIIFVDPSVQNYQSLIQNTPDSQIIILKENYSGIAQITQALAHQKNIEALHILSHGSPGSLNLGTGALNRNNLEKFSPQLKQWRKALTENADILLYGCEVAKGQVGQNFLKGLSEITGADIAASANLTGSAELGGDWKLEVQTGPIEARVPFNANSLKSYSGVLGFNPKVDFTAGNNSVSVSIGDINGDGKPDLALANFSSNTASILLNTTATGATTPTFATKVDFTTGSEPRSVSISDINGDGKPDLALVNFSSNSASILLNTTATGATTPTFATKVDFTTGSGPFDISISDINGDGKLDLAVANQASTSASILLNTTATGATTPTFATKVDFTTGTSPYSVSIGDLNGDGKPDLAVANQASTSASILLNTTATGATTPTFATKVDFTTGASPRSISIGDINSDGKPDLAVANFFSNSASILLNNAPKVTAVTATTADGSYGVGSTIAITVTFDAAVNVTGTPQLQLETGTTDRFATYTSGSGGNVLTFEYVVQAGDTSADLEYLATTALTLNGGTIKETIATAFDAFLTLPTTATANSLGGSKAIVIDTLAPTVALTSPSPTTVNAPFTVTATFSEDVIGFDNTDITVNNATISNFVKIDAKTYTFDVTPTTTGNITVDIPAAKATDAAGNNNIAANQLTRTADFTAPTVILTSTSATTVNAPFTVTATFSEDVIGFDNTDITVSNGTISHFTIVDAKTYTFDVTPTTTGNITVDIPTAKATDTAGNNNIAANQLTRTADITAPTVTLASTSATTINAPFSVNATFSEDVTGFDNTDLTVSNGTVSNFVKIDGKTYNFDVTPTADGSVTVDVPANKARDAVGNNNTAANQLVRTADITAPTANLGAISSITTTGGASQTLTVTFTDNSGVDVSSLDNSDLVINWSGGTTAANFVSVDTNSNGTPRTATYSFIPPGGSWDAADNATYTVNLQALQVKDTISNFAAGTNLGTFNVNIATPTPTPTPSVTPTPTPSVTPTPTPSVTPTPTPLVTPTPTPSVTPTPTPSVTPTPTPSVTPTPTPLVTPTPTPLVTPTPTPSVTPTPTPSEPETPTPTPIINNTPNDSCVCALIEYPNLNQPNEVENTILGTSYFQVGTEGNDLFLGSNSGNIFDAKSGNDNSYSGDSRDIINGNFGKDFISGGKGDDILFGDEDSDIILGDFGNDLIFGGKRADSLHGREDDDIIFGNRNDDFLDGGKGNDVLYGGKGKDIAFGSQGNDSLFGSRETDTICGGFGDDFVSGNEQDDLLEGCEENDTIYGGKDSDTLRGCQGDDILYGDLGNDSLIGGSGNDVFVLKAGHGFDTIGDFTVGQDLIGLSAGLSFSQLEFTENNRGTIIKNLLTGEELAVTLGVSKNVLTSASFLLV